MQGLLHWVMASPVRAGLVAAALALSRLFDILGAAVVALVALRKGPGPALLTASAGLPVVAVAAWLSGLGMALPLAVAGVWAPVIALSQVLRRTGSLALGLQAGAVLALAILAGWYLLTPEPQVLMRGLIEQQFIPVLERMQRGIEFDEQQLESLAGLAPGFIAAGSLLVTVVALLVGRWWQAVAYNPGGFRHDFHRLRHGRSATALVGLAVAIALASGHPIAVGAALTGATVLLMQGVAVAHGTVAALRQSSLWLWALYGALIFMPLPVSVALTVTGGLDNWMDFRRMAGQGAANPNE